MIVAGVILLLIAVLAGWAGTALLRNGPGIDDDVVAGEAAVRLTAIGILLACAPVLIAGIAAIVGSPTAWPLGLAACAIFVVYGFVANYVLFGSWRPEHTLTNVAIAALILWLLSRSGWLNGSKPARHVTLTRHLLFRLRATRIRHP